MVTPGGQEPEEVLRGTMRSERVRVDSCVDVDDEVEVRTNIVA